jgi:hypothetical protein
MTVTQFARGPINLWEASAIVPLDGQLVFARLADGTVEGRFGDGVSPWTGLPKISGGVGGANTERLDRAGIDAVSEGAVPNGSFDCTAILQDLLDDHDTVILTPGIYIISNTLRLKTNQVLMGTHRDKTIIRAALSMPNNLDLIMSANTNTSGVEHTNYLENITVANLTIDGRGDERSIVIPNDTHGCNIKYSTVRDSRIINIRSHDGVLHNIDVCASQYQTTPPPGSPGDPSTANKIMQGPSERVLIADCLSHDSVRDDPITCHDSVDILIERCVAYRTRALTSTDIHGIEIDEGNRRVTVRDCVAIDHNAGFQVKGHTNTTPARDVTFERCAAIRCRTSFDVYAANPSTLIGGATSWAENVAIIGCESIDPETKAIAPSDPVIDGIRVAGYRNVRIEHFVARGGSGEYANNIVLDFGCDDVIIDGVFATGVCSIDTGVGRGFITTSSTYGQGSGRVTVKNVVVETVMAIPVFRATNVATIVDLDGITALGSTGPMVWLGEVKATDRAVRLVRGASGYANLITVGAGTFAGTHDRDLTLGSGVHVWRKRLPANYTSVFHATDVADVGTTPNWAEVIITSAGPEDEFDVLAIFDVRHNTAAPVNASEALTCKFIGLISVDGVDQASSQAPFGVPGVQWARGTTCQTYEITGLAAGTHTLRMRARHTINLHPFTVAAAHTTITAKKTNASGWGAKVDS